MKTPAQQQAQRDLWRELARRRRQTPKGTEQNRRHVAEHRARVKAHPELKIEYAPGHWNTIHGVDEHGCPGCHSKPVALPGYPSLHVCGGCCGHLFRHVGDRWLILFVDEVTDP